MSMTVRIINTHTGKLLSGEVSLEAGREALDLLRQALPASAPQLDLMDVATGAGINA